MPTPERELARRVRARNDAEDSENPIHRDGVARQYGFGGGLVPGVTVYAYISVLPAQRWGREWLERGTMSVRLVKPVYDGEELDVRARGRDDGTLDLEVLGADRVLRAVGTARLPAEPARLPDVAGFPSVAPPDASARPAASEPVLSKVVLGTVERVWTAQDAPTFLAAIGEDEQSWPWPGVAHPGWLIRGANDVLSRNVRLGPWIHVSSDTVHHAAVGDGVPVSTRGNVARLYERKGHHFVELDVVVLAGVRPAWSIRHVAIYEPRPVSASP